jgi:hypothetical protein
MNLSSNFDRDGRDVVDLLHDLYATYPHQSHAVLAQALLQARKNLPPHEGPDAIRREAGRLLGVMAVLRLRADGL